jgi:atypical dual specificity phosphatase
MKAPVPEPEIVMRKGKPVSVIIPIKSTKSSWSASRMPPTWFGSTGMPHAVALPGPGGLSCAMNGSQKSNLLWWVIPKVLAGMPMPFIHPERRMAGRGALTAFDDELPILHSLRVCAVVSLLNLPSDASIYVSAGFAFLCLPIPDGGAPRMVQAAEFIRFVTEQLSADRPVAVHCSAGLGRTGTMLATYLIAQGANARAAIQQVRVVEKMAIETPAQIEFLEQYAEQ